MEISEPNGSVAAQRSSATGARASPTPSSPYRASASTSGRRSCWSRTPSWCCACSCSWRATESGWPRIRSRRIAEHLPALSRAFRRLRTGVWPLFREIFSLAARQPGACEAMHETGRAGGLFPEWAGIECLVVRDFYHRYTVDEHTLVAIQSLEDLPASEDPLRQRFAGLLEEVESRALLLVALLFHDVGKAARTGKHVEESVRLAEAALERLGAPAEARKVVGFLIERHLDLSTVHEHARSGRARPRRGSWPNAVGTVERLKDLTLLTYADISAVNPSAMTPWRLEQLWRAVPGHARRADARTGHGAHRGAPAISPEMAGFLAGFPGALPAHALRGGDPGALRAVRARARARRGGGGPQAKRDLLADRGGQRPAVPAGVDRRGAGRLRHEHPEGGSLRQPAGHDPGHLRVRGPQPHAGFEPDRDRPAAPDRWSAWSWARRT